MVKKKEEAFANDLISAGGAHKRLKAKNKTLFHRFVANQLSTKIGV